LNHDRHLDLRGQPGTRPHHPRHSTKPVGLGQVSPTRRSAPHL